MANRPTTAISETSPAGSDQINAGDNRIREYKTQNREILEEDHVYPSSGSSATAGFHKKVALVEIADLGSGATGLPILGGQTVSGKPELIYTDEDDNDVQMTTLGTPVAINGCAAKTTPVVADLLLLCDSADTYKSKKLTLANLMNIIYPVGAVVTLGVSTNPATLFGIGTWTAIAGKVIVGIDATQTEFDALNETGGSKTVDISHTHSVAGTYNAYWAQDAGLSHAAGTIPSGNPIATGSAGSATTSVLQPYIVKYVWERTA
jgi:hypothetical protein